MGLENLNTNRQEQVLNLLLSREVVSVVAAITVFFASAVAYELDDESIFVNFNPQIIYPSLGVLGLSIVGNVLQLFRNRLNALKLEDYDNIRESFERLIGSTVGSDEYDVKLQELSKLSDQIANISRELDSEKSAHDATRNQLHATGEDLAKVNAEFNDAQRRLAILAMEVDGLRRKQSEYVHVSELSAAAAEGLFITQQLAVLSESVSRFVGCVERHRGDPNKVAYWMTIEFDVEVTLLELETKVNALLFKYCSDEDPNREGNLAIISPIMLKLDEAKVALGLHDYKLGHRLLHEAAGAIGFFNSVYGAGGEEAEHANEMPDFDSNWINANGELYEFFDLFNIKPTDEYNDDLKTLAKKAFRRLSAIYHPDKEGGSVEIQKILTFANGVFQDVDQFRRYVKVYEYCLENNLKFDYVFKK